MEECVFFSPLWRCNFVLRVLQPLSVFFLPTEEICLSSFSFSLVKMKKTQIVISVGATLPGMVADQNNRFHVVFFGF